MINLPVSEAEAFDYLAILDVKIGRGITVCSHRYSEIMEAIDKQCQEAVTVRKSKHYQDLIDANFYCFDAVAMAVRDEIPASAVDFANQRRYAAKKALQERFWPSNPLTEVKAPRPSDLPCQCEKPTVPMTGGGK